MNHEKAKIFGYSICEPSAYITIAPPLIHSGRFNGRIEVIVLNYGKVNYTDARVHGVEYGP